MSLRSRTTRFCISPNPKAFTSMRIVATISNREKIAVIINVDGRVVDHIPADASFFDRNVKGRDACRPFGITWDLESLYIINNSQLLEYGFDFRLKARHDHVLHTNCHQAVMRDGLLWVASPWTNTIFCVCPARAAVIWELNPLAGRMARPETRDPNQNSDLYHFNGLLWAEERLFVTAHAFGPRSFILELDGRSHQLVRRFDNVGSMIHGIGYQDNQLFWLSSGTGELCSSQGLRHPLSRSGFARGLALSKETFVVGISERRSRDERFSGHSWIQLIDRRSLELVNEFFIEDAGSINELRLCDVFDYAHWRDPLMNPPSPETGL